MTDTGPATILPDEMPQPTDAERAAYSRAGLLIFPARRFMNADDGLAKRNAITPAEPRWPDAPYEEQFIVNPDPLTHRWDGSEYVAI